ncbi:MAG: HAD family hydrolase [Cytophagaceae bacterium]
MDFSRIKNIIFDLGGVIINIDFQYTYQAFARLANTSPEDIAAKIKQYQFFQRYESGQLTDDQFRNEIRKVLAIPVSDHEIDSAWNALLLDIPEKRIRLIQQLKNKYNIFLLSNTNAIHIYEVNKILFKSTGVKKLDDLFHKAYFSYDIQLLKPHKEIYDYVLKDQKIKAGETIFLDDNDDNITGAVGAGIHAIKVLNPSNILEILKDA